MYKKKIEILESGVQCMYFDLGMFNYFCARQHHKGERFKNKLNVCILT